MGVHAGDEGGELGMLVDGGLDRRLVHGEVEIAGTVGLEQRFAQLRADRPVRLERIDIGGGNAALQMPVDVLDILGRLAVDVARQVEVEVVLLDLLERDHAGVIRDVQLLVEDINDLVDVLRAEAVLGAVLHEAARWRRS